MQADEMMFFDAWRQLLPLYAAFRERVLFLWPDTQIRVQKTQISFYNRHLFACVFLPERRFRGQPRSYLGVSLGLGRALESPRAAMIAQPYPGRFTHHFCLTQPEEMDEEWENWLREAYTFAQNKK